MLQDKVGEWFNDGEDFVLCQRLSQIRGKSFSITYEFSQGTTLGNDAYKNITSKKGDKMLVFVE